MSDFGHWLAGFIDGEGCFTISPNDPARERAYHCRFKLKLRADDLAIVEEIHQRLEIGSITQAHYDHGNGVPNANPAVKWVVTNKSDCVQLVKILDQHPLRAKKARDYAIWREAVSAWCQVRPANSDPAKLAANGRLMAKMARLSQELQTGRRYPESEPSTVPSPVIPGQLQIV